MHTFIGVYDQKANYDHESELLQKGWRMFFFQFLQMRPQYEMWPK